MDLVKLLGMTGMLTALIWVTADSLVSETVTLEVSFAVEPAAPGSSMLVAVDPAAELFDVQVYGPRKLVEEVQAHGTRLVRLRIREYATGPANHPIDKRMLKRCLTERWKEFGKLTIVSVQPASLPLIVDHIVAREVDLTLPGLTLNYDDQPLLSHSRVGVRLRESAFRRLAHSGQLGPLDISADIERQLEERPAGESTTVSVALDAGLFGPDAELNPATIEVTATVSAQRTTADIPTVPILLAVSFANLGKPLTAVPRDGMFPVTRTIKVTGPTVEVQRLLRGETRAKGLIHLKEDDLEEWDSFRQMIPEYHLPPGIELAAEPKPIECKLAKNTLTED